MDERNFAFMFYGFAAAWIILVLYAVLLMARERHLKDEIETLRKMMKDRNS